MKSSVLVASVIILILPFVAAPADAQAREYESLIPRIIDRDSEILFPRISPDQSRPSRDITLSCEEGLPASCVENLDPGEGESSSSPNCLKNHMCTGGVICATGSCDAHTGKDCITCGDGSKCKGVRCTT
jgi:hypothetical protein